MNWKRNSKKYIAGILTIALAVGASQSYGSMEVSAQERTLPGIEKLVQDTVASSDGTFHILEIVPSKENATIGYLAGGEEPVSEGRKLSEMPSATERQTAMDSLDAAKFPTTGPVTFSAYSESTGASRTEDVRGRFVFRQDGSGRYNYQQIDAVYREIANGETVAAGERYNRYSALEAAGDSNRDAKSVTPVFSHRSTGGSNGLETTIINGSDSARGYAQGLYAISETDLAAIDKTSFQAKDYVDRTIYQKIGTGETAVYTYLGQIVYGTDAALPDGLKTTSRGVSGNDAGTAVQARTTSGGDAIAAYSAGDITQNLYILDHAQPDSAQLLAKWDDVSKAYTFETIASAYLVDFTANDNGDYYVSAMTVSDKNGDYRLIDTYRKDEAGSYTMVTPGSLQVTYKGEAGFDTANSYDFVGDDREDATETIAYNGGFYNKEWFKKNVLNLSGTSRYESGTCLLYTSDAADE